MSVDLDFPLLRFARALTVAHHIPGRIRLKLTGALEADLLAQAAAAKRFGQALGAMAGIRAISLNPLAKSCTIEYDAQIIPASAWDGLISGQDAPGTEILLQTLANAAKV